MVDGQKIYQKKKMRKLRKLRSYRTKSLGSDKEISWIKSTPSKIIVKEGLERYRKDLSNLENLAQSIFKQWTACTYYNYSKLRVSRWW